MDNLKFLQSQINAISIEITEVLENGFKKPKVFNEALEPKLNFYLKYPTFICKHSDFFSLLENPDERIKLSYLYSEIPKAELFTRRLSLETELSSMHEKACNIFSIVADLIKDSIRIDFEDANSKESKHEVFEKLYSIIDKIDDLKHFYGVKSETDPSFKSGGLIFGTEIFNCLWSIRHHGPLHSMLESDRLPVIDHYKHDLTSVNLSDLETLQKVSIPIAKEFIGVQYALKGPVPEIMTKETLTPSTFQGDSYWYHVHDYQKSHKWKDVKALIDNEMKKLGMNPRHGSVQTLKVSYYRKLKKGFFRKE